MDNYAFIMAGGIGERLWPLSKKTFPKQFLEIKKEEGSLLQLTYKRLIKFLKPENIFVITNYLYKDLTLKHLPEIPFQNVVLESSPKDTGTAICYATKILQTRIDSDANIIVVPSDSYLHDEKNYISDIKEGLKKSKEEECIVCIGIKPTEPLTDYSYINIERKRHNKTNCYKVINFRQNLNEKSAKKCVKDKDYLWNSGIYIFKLSTILRSFNFYMNGTSALVTDAMSSKTQKEFDDIFSKIEQISFEHGIIRKYKNLYCLKASFKWDSVSSFNSLISYILKDEKHNRTLGNVLNYKSKNNTIISQKKFIATLGVKNLVVVEGEDEILICNKSKLDDLKDLLNKIKDSENKDHL